MENPKRPNKNAFIKQLRDLKKIERSLIAVELLEQLDKKLPEKRNLMHSSTLTDLKYIREKFKKTNKLPLKDIFKLYLVAYYPVTEINHWVMTEHQCYRMKKVQKDRWASAISELTKAKRSPSIYDVNGDVVPMKWRKKHLPDWVKTQTDYELYLTDPKTYNRINRQKQIAKKMRERRIT